MQEQKQTFDTYYPHYLRYVVLLAICILSVVLAGCTVTYAQDTAEPACVKYSTAGSMTASTIMFRCIDRENNTVCYIPADGNAITCFDLFEEAN